ncbi:hypothetical protein GCM10023221_20800 [Luteimicrobium xylanilyticum]
MSYVAGMLVVTLLDHVGADDNLGLGFLQLALVLVTLGAPVVLLLLAATRGHAHYRSRRRTQGHLTKAEQAAAQVEGASRRAWDEARALRAALLRHEPPPTMQVWDVVPYDGEVFFCDVPAGYARFYGTDVTYTQTSGFFFGRPSFVLAGLAATAIGNAASRNAARRAAQKQWREHTICRLVVSNRRLLTQIGGRWLSFHYAGMTAIYPEPAGWALVCQFSDAEPLMLSGHHAPFAAVMTMFMTHGEDALLGHPALAPLV